MTTKLQNPRRMSVRAIVTWLAIAMGGLSLMVLIELVAVTAWMHQATERMASGAEGVRAAEQLDVSLRAFNRERYLLARTGQREHAGMQKKFEAEINDSLAIASLHTESTEEDALLKNIHARVAEFIGQPEIPTATVDPEAFKHYLEGTQVVDAIGEEVSQLININVHQANTAREESLKLDQIANLSAIVLALILVVSIAATLFWVRRALYRPFEEIRETISSYAAGELDARASEAGPDELRVIASRFNDMADKLAQQRETQLQFLAAIAHDLRNPLMALRLAAAVMEKNGAATPRDQVQHQMLIVRRQIDRLDRMVGDFMDVSLIENGQFSLNVETRDLRLLAQNVVELFRPTTTQHRFELSLPSEPIAVECDLLRMEQVLNNLVSNAIKYSPEGGVVRVGCKRNDDSVVLSVTDQGIGISQEDRKKLFAPFSRVGQSQGKIPGIGLGLSVTRRLVEAHHGHVEVESTIGQGSTFYVHLPLKVEVSSPEPAHSRAGQA